MFSRTRSAGSTASTRAARASQVMIKRASSAAPKMQHDRAGLQNDLALLDAHFTGELRTPSAEHSDTLSQKEGGGQPFEGEPACSAAAAARATPAEIQRERPHAGTNGPHPSIAAATEAMVMDACQEPAPAARMLLLQKRGSDHLKFRGSAMVDGRDVEMTDFAEAGVILVAKSAGDVERERLGAEAGEGEELEVRETSRQALAVLVCGVLQAQLGMIMFNLGLNFGFTSLGDQVVIACALLHSDSHARSPSLPLSLFLSLSLPPHPSVLSFLCRSRRCSPDWYAGRLPHRQTHRHTGTDTDNDTDTDAGALPDQISHTVELSHTLSISLSRCSGRYVAASSLHRHSQRARLSVLFFWPRSPSLALLLSLALALSLSLSLARSLSTTHTPHEHGRSHGR